MKFLLFLFTILSISISLPVQDLSAYEKKLFILNKDTLRYRILYPIHYNPHKKYPVLTFLHGSGERGDDNESQLIHGGTLFLNDTLRKRFRAIVIFPQLPKDSLWDHHTKIADPSSPGGESYNFTFAPDQTIPSFLVKSLLNSLIKDNIADRRRMYIGGLSFGSMGTFDMIERFPGFFAAAFPICGGGDTTKAKLIAGKTAVWIFHGDADQAVNVKYARQYYAALKNYILMYVTMNIRVLATTVGTMHLLKKIYCHGCFQKENNRMLKNKILI
jgi:predicted peptidase